jgi:chitodextrinase
MIHPAYRRLIAHLALFALLFAYVAPAAIGASAAVTKRPHCKAGKVAVHKKKRVRVRVAVRRHGRVVGHRRVWKKKWVWSCVVKRAVGAGPAADIIAPSTPGGLTATAGDRRLTLVWNVSTDNVGVVGYRVYRDGVLVGTVAANSFTDTGLTNGTSYRYLLVAYDAAANASTAAAITTAPALSLDTTPPSAAPGFTATAGDRQVDLAWDASTDDVKVVFYQVFRDGVPIVAQEGRTFTDTGLVNGTKYVYTVFAHDSADNVSAAATASATPADKQAPTVPSGLAATPGNTQVSLTWSTATDNVAVTGYRVYRNGTLVASPTTPYYADTGRTNGTSYSYTVAAVDAAGNASAKSGAVSATPAAPSGSDTTPPSVPAGLTATGGTAQVSLTWSASTDAVGVTGYRVYRDGVQIATPAGPSFVDTGRTNGVTYSYKVAAVDSAGNLSAQSTAATATPGDTTAPTVPSGMTVTKNNSAHTITIAWAASTDNVAVVRYKVYRSKNGAAAVVAAQPTTLSYVETNLSNGATYAYTVSAVDGAGNESAQSPVVSTYVS